MGRESFRHTASERIINRIEWLETSDCDCRPIAVMNEEDQELRIQPHLSFSTIHLRGRAIVFYYTDLVSQFFLTKKVVKDSFCGHDRHQFSRDKGVWVGEGSCQTASSSSACLGAVIRDNPQHPARLGGVVAVVVRSRRCQVKQAVEPFVVPASIGKPVRIPFRLFLRPFCGGFPK